MRRIYAVIDLKETSTFDPADDMQLDEMAEDLLAVAHGVASATVYSSFSDLKADET